MKNYLYFAINDKIRNRMAGAIDGTLTIELDKVIRMQHRSRTSGKGAVSDAIEGAAQMGGSAYRTSAEQADIDVTIIPATADAGSYFGADYNAGGKFGSQAAVAGTRYLLTETQSYTFANNSQDIVIKGMSGSGADTDHGVKGADGDIVEIRYKGAAAGDAVGGHDHDNDADRSGLFAIWPESSFLGAEVVSQTQIDVHFKSVAGTWARDIVSIFHAGAGGDEKEIMNVLTNAVNAGKMYQGLIPVYDGGDHFDSDLLSHPNLNVAGISIALNQ